MMKKQYVTSTITLIRLMESDCITSSAGDNLVDDVFVPGIS